MKDIFNEHQRFSIRKFSFGAASVLLGSVFLAQAQAVQAEEATSHSVVATNSSTEDSSAVDLSTSEVEPATSTSVPVLSPEVSEGVQEDTNVFTVETKEVSAPEVKTVDKTSLNEKVKELRSKLASVSSTSKTASAIVKAETVLNEAQALLDSDEASQDEVDAQVKKVSSQSFIIDSMPKEKVETSTPSEAVTESAKTVEEIAVVPQPTVGTPVAEVSGVNQSDKEVPATESQISHLKEIQADLTDYLPQASKVNEQAPIIEEAKASLATVTASLNNTNLTASDLEELVKKASRTRNSLINLVTGSNSGSRDGRNGLSMGEGTSLYADNQVVEGGLLNVKQYISNDNSQGGVEIGNRQRTTDKTYIEAKYSEEDGKKYLTYDVYY